MHNDFWIILYFYNKFKTAIVLQLKPVITIISVHCRLIILYIVHVYVYIALKA